MNSPKYTLYYGPGTCALAGIITLEWIARPYQLGRVTGKILWSDIYRKINPLTKVPALSIDGRILLENNAILTHLANSAPDAKLSPQAGTPERDTLNQWLSYLGTEFHPAFWPWFMPQRYTTDESHYSAVKSASEAMVSSKFAYLNEHLADKQYMLGTQRTILDPYFFAMARWGENFLDISADYPNVARHLEMMRADATVQFGLSVEAGDIVNAADGGGPGFQGHVKLT
ncbi:glutathione S-transferase N-terminal domain-containing protein [Chloroflexi bacterium TSY]|nr:glutathione S-transferase N-terminal domain-containing protein [Chloroflexi bacterium TSY]